VDHVPGVQVFESLGHLIDNEADMDIFEDIFRNDIVQVRLHKLKYQIDVFVVVSLESVVEFDDVGVISLLQYFDLTVGALCICGMLKGVEYLFESVNLFGHLLLYLPDMSVGTRAHLFYYVEPSKDVALEIGCVGLGHTLYLCV
jgi:hypothetical protein